MSLSHVTRLLEDISLNDPAEEQDDVRISGDGELSPEDQKVADLLELVGTYEQLIRRQNHQFANGYLTLSRANYNLGITKRYGAESYDQRPYEAITRVKFNGEFSLDDKPEDKADLFEDKGDVSEDKADVEAPEQKLRKRGKAAKAIKDTKAPAKAFDPIYQFGGIVPYQLRQSQTYFSSGLEVAIAAYNIRRQISRALQNIN